MEWRPPTWVRAAEIALGSLSIVVVLIVVLNPSSGYDRIVTLLAFAVLLNALRIVATGGATQLPAYQRALNVGFGLIAAGIIGFVLVSPRLGFETLTLLLATGLAFQGVDRLLETIHRGHPNWLRLSALTVGVTTLALAVFIVTFPKLTVVSLTTVITATIVVNGADSIIAGIGPSTKKQQTLAKLVAFAMFYGFVNVNWIDLYYNRVPAYHIWLILTYMAPFGVLLVFQGLKDWQLALSLGLLVSLVNDLGYYFTADLLFGFHRQIVPWLAGQLGFEGNKALFIFQGGLFRFPVTSYLMGASVYARFLVVIVVLYHWWKRPEELPG